MEEFKSEIKKYRHLAGMTQEELADAVKVRRETILRLEKGKYNPSLALAVRISEVLKTPLENLFIFK